MKVGSLVECINDSHIHAPNIGKEIKRGDIYTIRELGGVSGTGVYLEEIVSEYVGGVELFYQGRRFREVVPPMGDVEEYIKENSLELQEL